MKVFLFGFMGSGKTTYGRQLAKKMNLDFFDLDEYIENREGKSIPEIFESSGEEGFRIKERDALSQMLQKDNYILATGGGTPCFFDNISRMNASGMTVYIEMTPHALLHRLREANTRRPLIKGKSTAQLLEYIETTLSLRNPYYQQARLTVDGMNLDMNELQQKIEKASG